MEIENAQMEPEVKSTEEHKIEEPAQEEQTMEEESAQMKLEDKLTEEHKIKESAQEEPNFISSSPPTAAEDNTPIQESTDELDLTKLSPAEQVSSLPSSSSEHLSKIP